MNEKARALLGKRVRIVIDKTIIVTGTLLAFAEDGEVVTQDDNEVIWFSWPMLDIEEA